LEIQGRNRQVVVAWSGFDGLPRNKAKANADYIVRCVNAHDVLLEYVQHKRGCITEVSPLSAGANSACDCGFGQILAGLES
jgi:hypothetical protein